MKFKYKTALYFFLVFFGGGLLLFRDDIQGEGQIVLTIIALIAMMFGMYKVTTLRTTRAVDEDEDQDNEHEDEHHIK